MGIVLMGLNKHAVVKLFAFAVVVSVLILPFHSFSGTDSEGDALSGSESDTRRYGGVYRRGLGNEPTVLDPARISDIYETNVTQQIFEGLVQYSDNLMVIPCLAKSWDSSRDNLRWTFNIRKGATFHNGREVYAEDFVYSFHRVFAPGLESLAASFPSVIKGADAYRKGEADRIEGLRAVGKHTLEIELSEPFSPFIAMLAMVNFSVVPKEEVEKLGDAFGVQPVGTGPFIFDHWYPGSEVGLRANEDYYDGRPYLDKVIFRIFPGASAEEMFLEFENGNLEDSIISASDRERVYEEQNYLILHRPSLVLRFFVMNNRTVPFTDRKVRQAFNYAIDKETLSIEVGRGRLIPATGLIPEGMAGYRPDDSNYPYDVEKAKKLMSDAGYPEGRGLPPIQFWSSVKSKGLLAEDEMITRYLSDIGVNVQFNYLTDWPKFKKMLQDGKAPIFKYSWQADVPDPDNILSLLFHSQSPTNRAFYNNSAVDNLIERAQNEADYGKRISLFSDVEDTVMEDAPVILLNYLAYERVFQTYVQNIRGNALGDHYFPLKRVWLSK
jgi:peptide/nickel transport system substrate-binding protein/oligopeptide transport system substrate-binding protein